VSITTLKALQIESFKRHKTFLLAMRARNIILVLTLIGIIMASSAFVFIKGTDKDTNNIKPLSIIKSKVSSLFLQQENLDNEHLSEETETISLEVIPDKYKGYIENADSIIDETNKFLEDKTQFIDIVKSIDEQGINLIADDVSFYVEFDEEGLIDSVVLGINNEYDSIVVQNDLDIFVESALNAKETSDYMDLLSDVDIPLKYYLKVPKIIKVVMDMQSL